MAKINKTLKHVVRKTKWPWVKLRLILKKNLGWLGTPVIYPYTGYCNGREVRLSGSVIEDRGLSKPHERQSNWSNILAMIKRYVGDEFAGVRISIEFMGHKEIVETDETGFFGCEFLLSKKVNEEVQWETARYRLLDQIIEDQPEVEASGSVLMISRKPQFMVISDIDDTFLVSHSTRTVKKIRLMLFKNALTRLPFPGVAAFYRALQKGTDHQSFNPLFYVSSSERNLYDLLFEFCKFRDIPKGPFLLREMQTSIRKLITAGGGDHLHKLEKIRSLLKFYPEIPVILIGDSGQRDPEIYLRVVKEFPGRVASIYIRCIGRQRKIDKTADLAAEAAGLNVDMILVQNTEEASRHAVLNGFIKGDALGPIEKEKQKDEET